MHFETHIRVDSNCSMEEYGLNCAESLQKYAAKGCQAIMEIRRLACRLRAKQEHYSKKWDFIFCGNKAACAKDIPYYSFDRFAFWTWKARAAPSNWISISILISSTSPHPSHGKHNNKTLYLSGRQSKSGFGINFSSSHFQEVITVLQSVQHHDCKI